MLPDPVSCEASWIWHTRESSMDIFQAVNYMRIICDYIRKKNWNCLGIAVDTVILWHRIICLKLVPNDLNLFTRIDQFIRWHETKFYKSYLIGIAKKIVITIFRSIYKKTKLIDFVHFWCGRNQHFAQLSPIRITLGRSFRDIRKELSVPLQWNLPTIGRILSQYTHLYWLLLASCRPLIFCL